MNHRGIARMPVSHTLVVAISGGGEVRVTAMSDGRGGSGVSVVGGGG